MRRHERTIGLLIGAAIFVAAAVLVALAWRDHGHGQPPPSFVASAVAPTLTVSPSGSDASCSRGGSACATFERACELAQAGDSVAVNGGAYPADYPGEGAVKLLARCTPGITFACGDGSAVTFAAPADQFVVTAHDLTLAGSCFHFNRLWIGDAPNGISTQNVTVSGATMLMFQVSGSSNVTIANSTVGPDTACAAAGAPAACLDLTATGERYFARAGRPNTQYTSPKVNTGGASGAVPSRNVLLLNDRFTVHQTRDSGQWHGECLFIDDAGGSGAVQGGSFDGCFFADVFVNNPASAGWTFNGATWAASKEPINGGTDPGAIPDTSPAYVDLAVKCQPGEAVTGWTITGNTFAHGWDLDSGGCTAATFPGLTISGNAGGSTQAPPQSGGIPTTTTTTTPSTTTTTATTSTTTPVADVPTAIRETLAVLAWMHRTRKTGGLGYSVAQTQTTHAYRALVALGGAWNG